MAALLPATGGSVTFKVVEPDRVCEQLGGLAKVTLTRVKVEVTTNGIVKFSTPEDPIFIVAFAPLLIV
jgi:hypothetical protein